MRKSVLLLVVSAAILGAARLHADSVTTPEGTTFEGIVTKFAKDGKLVLSTGYGDLTFEVESDVTEAATEDYSWPKAAHRKAPSRAAEFETWSEERKKSNGKQGGNDDPSWTDVKKGRYDDEEASIDTIWKSVDAYESLRGNPEKSVNEKDKAFKNIKKLNGKWRCVSVAVDSVQRQGDELTVEFQRTYKKDADGETDWGGRSGFRGYDARTGKPTEAHFSDFFTLRAKKGLSAKEVDELNKSAAVEKGLRGEREFYVDWDEAAGWKRGSGVVFVITLSVKSNDEILWQVIPTRVRPLAAPKTIDDAEDD
ncbi:MAG: hypothetical protein KDB82_15740 [Planctomycetes bacterium]|nr:hypothetical protein [Planctomycetota bacterium]